VISAAGQVPAPARLAHECECFSGLLSFLLRFALLLSYTHR
jgi:hypothetical protein